MLANPGKILVITGPTCTGKSRLALELAIEMGGEIVNADSMQVYKYFDIGTAKPPISEQERVWHHLVDIVEPHEEFNAAIFRDRADRSIRGIWERQHLPIVVGGTGLYIRALLHDLFKVPADRALRLDLQQIYDRDPLQFYERVRKIDPEYCLKISFRDKRRMVRAMEVFQLTGFSMSEWSRRHGFKGHRYDALKIGLQESREILFNRINERVDTMLAQGWVQEVKSILSRGFDERLKPFTAIGYREIVQHLRGSITYEDMVRDIKKYTRHYAKRQFTWFSGEKDITWYAHPKDRDRIQERVKGFLK